MFACIVITYLHVHEDMLCMSHVHVKTTSEDVGSILLEGGGAHEQIGAARVGGASPEEEREATVGGLCRACARVR